jgi:hypothetical protein
MSKASFDNFGTEVSAFASPRLEGIAPETLHDYLGLDDRRPSLSPVDVVSSSPDSSVDAAG